MNCYCPFDKNLQLSKDFYAIHLHVVNHVLLFTLLCWISFENVKPRCEVNWGMRILLAVLSLAVSKIVHYYAVLFFYFFFCRFYAWFMFTTLVYFLSDKVCPYLKRQISAAEHEDIFCDEFHQMPVLVAEHEDISCDEFHQMPVLVAEQEGSRKETRDSGLLLSPSALNHCTSQRRNHIILPSLVTFQSVLLSLIGLTPVTPPSDSRHFVNAEPESTFSKTGQASEISTKVRGIEQLISTDGLNVRDLSLSSPSTSGYTGSRNANLSGVLSLPPLSRPIPFDQPGTSSASQYTEDTLSEGDTWNSSQAAGRNTEGKNIVRKKNNPDPPVANLLQSVFRQIHPIPQAPPEFSPYSSGIEDGNTPETITTSNQMVENSGDAPTVQKRRVTRKRKVKKPINYHPPKTRRTRQTKT